MAADIRLGGHRPGAYSIALDCEFYINLPNKLLRKTDPVYIQLTDFDRFEFFEVSKIT